MSQVYWRVVVLSAVLAVLLVVVPIMAAKPYEGDLLPQNHLVERKSDKKFRRG